MKARIDSAPSPADPTANDTSPSLPDGTAAVGHAGVPRAGSVRWLAARGAIGFTLLGVAALAGTLTGETQAGSVVHSTATVPAIMTAGETGDVAR